MKLTRKTAVVFLIALGFSKAGEWDDAKIIDRMKKVPSKVAEAPEGHERLYAALKEADGKVILSDTPVAPVAPVEAKKPAAEKPPAAKKPVQPELKIVTPPAPKKSKPAPVEKDVTPLEELTKKELLVIIEEEELAVKLSKKVTQAEIISAIKKARKAKAPAVVEKPVVKAPKTPAPAPVKAPRDALGCKLGTISAKVDAVLLEDLGEWKDENEVAEAAGVTLDQARGRLYYAAEKKVFEYRRLIQYRVPKAVKS